MPGASLLDCYSPTGQYLDSINDWTRIECTMSEMGIGTLVIDAPPTHDPALYQQGEHIVRDLRNGRQLRGADPVAHRDARGVIVERQNGGRRRHLVDGRN